MPTFSKISKTYTNSLKKTPYFDRIFDGRGNQQPGQTARAFLAHVSRISNAKRNGTEETNYLLYYCRTSCLISRQWSCNFGSRQKSILVLSEPGTFKTTTNSVSPRRAVPKRSNLNTERKTPTQTAYCGRCYQGPGLRSTRMVRIYSTYCCLALNLEQFMRLETGHGTRCIINCPCSVFLIIYNHMPPKLALVGRIQHG